MAEGTHYNTTRVLKTHISYSVNPLDKTVTLHLRTGFKLYLPSRTA